MKLSTRARYALQIMVAITKLCEDGKPVSIAKVAERTEISKRYLEKLVATLRKGGLLDSVSGRTGGYLLASSPEEIKIGQIVEASIGPVNIVDCVGFPTACLKSDGCECRLIYALINQRIAEALSDYTLADMTDPRWRNRIERQLLPV